MKKVFVIGLMCCLAVGTFAAGTINWKVALQNANQKVDSKSASSHMGIDIAAMTQRISKQVQNAKRLKETFDAHTKKTQCYANYKRLGKEMRKNKLFAQYELSALYARDFCNLKEEDMGFLIEFFQNKQKPVEAVQYEKAILLTLRDGSNVFWFIAEPEDRILSLNVNDPVDLNGVESLKGKYQKLSV